MECGRITRSTLFNDFLSYALDRQGVVFLKGELLGGNHRPQKLRRIHTEFHGIMSYEHISVRLIHVLHDVLKVGVSHGFLSADPRGRVNDQEVLQEIDRQGSGQRKQLPKIHSCEDTIGWDEFRWSYDRWRGCSLVIFLMIEASCLDRQLFVK